MKKIYLDNNYIIFDLGDGTLTSFSIKSVYKEQSDSFWIKDAVVNTVFSITFQDVSNWFDSTGTVAYTEETLRTFLRSNTGNSGASGSGGSAKSLYTATGYSFTGAFEGKPLSNNYVWEAGIGINYSQSDVDSDLWKVFSLDEAVHLAVDNPYWTDPAPTGVTGIGLFEGEYLPDGVSSLVDYTYDFDSNYPGSTGTGFEGSTGRIRLNDLQPGDELRVRFDFNIIPQIANTTIEVALWYSNRDADDNITFTFPLTTTPIFYGTGSVGKTFLNRPEITAWIASQEDINALTLPAIKADNPVIIQPLGMKILITR